MCDRCNIDLPAGGNGEPHTQEECPFPDNPPNNTPILSADWEGGDIGWRLVRFDENGINETNQGIGREDILDAFLWDNEQIILIIETAHLQPRSNPPKSKAQIFTNEELQLLEESLQNSGSIAYAFPNNRCKIAKHLAGYGDDKTLDPYAQILFYLNYAQGQEIPHPRSIDLKRWRVKSTHSRAMDLLSDQVRIDMTVRLNSFRAIHAHEDSPQDYDTTEFPYDEVRNAIRIAENILELDLLCDENDVDLNEEVKEYFNLGGENLEDLIGTDSVMRLMTLYVCVFNEGGSVRTHESMLGQIPTQLINRFEQIEEQDFPLTASTNSIGLRFIWDRLLFMTPYKGKTGGQFTARANMMYRGLRNYDHSNISDEEFLMKPCPVPSCHAGEGDQCTMPNGTLRAAGMHVKRKSVHWNEPDNFWILRQANRQRWRKIQKTMLRALIQVGTDNKG
ncbi:hypothetical protein OAO11_04115 [Candidatus Poseidoniaceae archaeon]|nr:hypothetical protein [Candidatus Poseidoniaceae archaeon]